MRNCLFFFAYGQSGRHMRNHKGMARNQRHRGLFYSFRTLIAAVFRPLGMVMGTFHQLCPETLLAGVNTTGTDFVILPPAVFSDKKRPFFTPFLASAHRSPCSGVLRPLCCFSDVGLSAHSRLASANRSRMEGFFSVVSFAFSSSSPRLPLLMTPSIMP